MTSCKEKNIEKEYQQDDQVIEDGVIYTYYTRVKLYDEHIPFMDEEKYKPYYNYYYYDMSDVKNQKKIVSFNHFPYSNGNGLGEKYGDADVIEGFLKNCSTLYSPTEAYFFRLRDYIEETAQRKTIQGGFLATGYTKNLKKDVIIPKSIREKPVLGIGFKAFQNAPMESLVLQVEEWPGVILHPFAISKCPNLKYLDLSYCITLSMSISNCPNIEKIKDIRLGYDCTLYNLPKLKEIDGLNTYINRGIADMWFPLTLGIRKSAIYLCPNFEKVRQRLYKANNVMRRGNALYVGENESIPVYVFDDYEIILFDEWYKYLSFDNYLLSACYDEETLQMYIPAINNGLDYKGKFYVASNSKLYIEKEDGYYANIAYPKIIEGVEVFPTEKNDPILLKIAPKSIN